MRDAFSKTGALVLLSGIACLHIGFILGTVRVMHSIDSPSIRSDAAEVPQHDAGSNYGHNALDGRSKHELARAYAQFFPHLRDVDRDVPFRDLRGEGAHALHNWTHVQREVEEAGHFYCSLYRDNWSCVGERYKETLRRTPLFDRSLDLNAFPPNSNLYIEGNSFMGQLIHTIVCNTDGVDVIWLLDGEDSSSLYVRTLRGTSLLLICNNKLQYNPPATVEMLRKTKFTPDIIVRGSVNWKKIEDFISLAKQHDKVFTEAFPEALYLPYLERHLPSYCAADFQNCGKIEVNFCDIVCVGKHSCLPGPAHTFAEDLVRLMVSTSDRNTSIPR